MARQAARVSMAKSRQALQPMSKNVAKAASTRSIKNEEASIKQETKREGRSVKDEQHVEHEPVSRKRAPSIAGETRTVKKARTEKGLKQEEQDDQKDRHVQVKGVEEGDVKEELKQELNNELSPSPAKPKKSTAADLQTKKLKSYKPNESPFPDFKHPTAAECKLAHRILAQLHGERTRPTEVVASTSRAGCGDSPSVLDALVRTILSQNTSDTNSTRAKLSMDRVYGRSDKWEAIVEGGQVKLQEAIKCGGLSVVKSKVIMSILQQSYEKYGKYSLDHLHQASSEEAMREMLSFQGVGPKTASCVLLFCLGRESFAVDTHVWRITGLLGWRPKNASRDETHAHLDVRIPDEDKYGLHILLVTHGKRCDECKAGGRNLGKCKLRQAFREGKVKGEAGEGVQAEEVLIEEEEEKHKKRVQATQKKVKKEETTPEKVKGELLEDASDEGRPTEKVKSGLKRDESDSPKKIAIGRRRAKAKA